MADRLLWIEVLVKLASGLALIAFPRSLPLVLGLPSGTDTFWPRLLGATLLGLGAATVLPGRPGAPGSLGLAGHLTLDLVAALTLAALLLAGRAGPQRRGRALLWLLAFALAALALVELAWV